MRLLQVIAFFVALSSCTAGQDESPEAGSEQVEASSSQLAQYPGAPYEDRQGNLWFSTVFEGLIRYDGTEFVTFTTEDGLASNSVRDLFEDEDGTLWIATTGGVSLHDGESFRTLTDYVDTPVTRTFSEEGDHCDVWDILKDSKGTLWIATMDGVFRHDGTSFVPFPLSVSATEGSFEFTSKMVYSIFEDRDGVLWFGTDGAGAVSYDGTTQVVYTEESHGLCSDRICTIVQDRRGDYWFGTSDGGVSRYDGRAFTTHLRSSEHSIHTGWGRFMGILEDPQGNVWFGVSSQGGGVHRFDGETFRYFSEEDGLGDGGVPSLSLDRKGKLWLGTTAGVYRLEGERFVNFTRKG